MMTRFGNGFCHIDGGNRVVTMTGPFCRRNALQTRSDVEATTMGKDRADNQRPGRLSSSCICHVKWDTHDQTKSKQIQKDESCVLACPLPGFVVTSGRLFGEWSQTSIGVVRDESKDQSTKHDWRLFWRWRSQDSQIRQ